MCAPINITPDDCLACDGYILKISDYKKLYLVIGKAFNSGNELEDEFKIPDYNITGRFLQAGMNASKIIYPGLPNITGSFSITRAAPTNGTGAFSTTTAWGWGEGDNVSTGGGNAQFNASHSNAIYGASTTVQPPSQIVHLCIKYR